ncbi:MAG: response regulator transcription factor [Spirochaetia bacterium]|nr:response regulator transcription factor [Spirochaetia bacterium]
MKTGNVNFIRAAIVDDDENFRRLTFQELEKHPQIEYLAEFSSCEKFWRSDEKDNFDFVFLDISMPGLTGIELIEMMQIKNIKGKIIMLTNLDSEDTIFKAIKHGAVGYLWKSEIYSIKDTIDVVLNGGAMISPTIALKILNSYRAEENTEPSETKLTVRERQVLEILAKGLKSENVSKEMHISVNTVKKHIRNIYEKLQVKNRVELMSAAKKSGII